MRKHAGQVAFPGGALDPTDARCGAAALREATEEVGLDPATVEIVADAAGDLHPARRDSWSRRCWPGGRVPHPVGRSTPPRWRGWRVVPIAELADPANRFQVTPSVRLAGAGLRGWRAVRLGLHRRAAGPAARARRLGASPGTPGAPGPLPTGAGRRAQLRRYRRPHDASARSRSRRRGVVAVGCSNTRVGDQPQPAGRARRPPRSSTASSRSPSRSTTVPVPPVHGSPCTPAGDDHPWYTRAMARRMTSRWPAFRPTPCR